MNNYAAKPIREILNAYLSKINTWPDDKPIV